MYSNLMLSLIKNLRSMIKVLKIDIKKILFVIFLLFLFCLLPRGVIHAQGETIVQTPEEETLEAVVGNILEEKKLK